MPASCDSGERTRPRRLKTEHFILTAGAWTLWMCVGCRLTFTPKNGTRSQRRTSCGLRPRRAYGVMIWRTPEITGNTPSHWRTRPGWWIRSGVKRRRAWIRNTRWERAHTRRMTNWWSACRLRALWLRTAMSTRSWKRWWTISCSPTIWRFRRSAAGFSWRRH